MAKAFVDTTILADVLLKRDDLHKAAKEALRRFEITELPVYAIKEFKAGPLSKFVWFHNKLALLKSYHKALDALQKMSLTPRKYTTSTALEALKGVALQTRYTTLKQLEQKYGDNAKIDRVLCDQYRLTLKTRIITAWKNRRQVTSHVVNPLPCYNEVAPYEENGLIVVNPVKCQIEKECCLAPALKSNPADLELLRKAVLKQSSNREQQRRSQALRELIRKPKKPMIENTCRNLGDAVFTFFAPPDSSILTTNLKDHFVLANALGKKAESP